MGQASMTVTGALPVDPSRPAPASAADGAASADSGPRFEEHLARADREPERRRSAGESGRRSGRADASTDSTDATEPTDAKPDSAGSQRDSTTGATASGTDSPADAGGQPPASPTDPATATALAAATAAAASTAAGSLTGTAATPSPTGRGAVPATATAVTAAGASSSGASTTAASNTAASNTGAGRLAAMWRGRPGQLVGSGSAASRANVVGASADPAPTAGGDRSAATKPLAAAADADATTVAAGAANASDAATALAGAAAQPAPVTGPTTGPGAAGTALTAIGSPATGAGQATAQPSFEPPAGQVAASLRTLAGRPDGVHVMVVRLHPDDLGPVRVVARLVGTDVHLRVSATTNAAVTALNDAGSRFHDALNGSGLKAVSVLVDRDDSAGGQQNPTSYAADQSFGEHAGRSGADHGGRPGSGPADSGVRGPDAVPTGRHRSDPPPARAPARDARSLDLHL